jgi:hypothetical protein
MGELADRVLALKDNAEEYLNLGEEEPDEQILQTAAEIDANMTYLGLDDAIIQLASEVRDLEQRDQVRMADIVAQVEMEDGNHYVFWRCPECHAQVLVLYEGEGMERIRMQQSCSHTFDQPEMKIVTTATIDGNADELMLRLADAWDIFVHLSSRAEDAYGDDAPEWLDLWISRLEFALQGDPGHQEPHDFQVRRKGRVAEHGPRLQWGASQITETPE